MKKITILNEFKQEIKRILPKDDGRTKVSNLDFFIGTMMCFFGDSKTFSLDSIRRFIISQSGIKICKSSFWERLAGKRFNKILRKILSNLIKKTSVNSILPKSTLKKLGVDEIQLIDSSSITLWDGAKKNFPGSRTNAGIKLHACFNIVTGLLSWFDLSPTSTNDRKKFPDVKSLFKKLIIFDLGYWDYGLLHSIDKNGGFFLSRIKKNAAIMVKEAVFGISKIHEGKTLSELQLYKGNSKIIELTVTVKSGREEKEFRAIAFWNKKEKKYHWYITNLKANRIIIRVLYRIRWQIELIFKSNKRSLNLDGRLKSNNKNIIEALVMLTLIANYLTAFIMKISGEKIRNKNKVLLSLQKAAQIIVILTNDFTLFFKSKSEKIFKKLIKKIVMFSGELFEGNLGNRKKRKTTMEELKGIILTS